MFSESGIVLGNLVSLLFGKPYAVAELLHPVDNSLSIRIRLLLTHLQVFYFCL
jgi:hypothetical protein